MSMEYIRKYYGVPAKRGARVVYRNPDGVEKHGTVTSAIGSSLKVRLDGEKRSKIFHPTWCLLFVEPRS